MDRAADRGNGEDTPVDESRGDDASLGPVSGYHCGESAMGMGGRPVSRDPGNRERRPGRRSAGRPYNFRVCRKSLEAYHQPKGPGSNERLVEREGGSFVRVAILVGAQREINTRAPCFDRYVCGQTMAADPQVFGGACSERKRYGHIGRFPMDGPRTQEQEGTQSKAASEAESCFGIFLDGARHMPPFRLPARIIEVSIFLTCRAMFFIFSHLSSLILISCRFQSPATLRQTQPPTIDFDLAIYVSSCSHSELDLLWFVSFDLII